MITSDSSGSNSDSWASKTARLASMRETSENKKVKWASSLNTRSQSIQFLVSILNPHCEKHHFLQVSKHFLLLSCYPIQRQMNRDRVRWGKKATFTVIKPVQTHWEMSVNRMERSGSSLQNSNQSILYLHWNDLNYSSWIIELVEAQITVFTNS